MRSKNNSSYYRNFVFGVEDSLVSTVGLLSGISIAGVNNQTIITTGLVLIFVEAISMGAGSFLSESSVEIYENQKDGLTDRSYIDALIMFVSYIIFGFIPLLPYMIFPQTDAFWISIGLSIFILSLFGAIGARVSGTSMWKSVARMVIVGGVAITVGAVVGRVF